MRVVRILFILFALIIISAGNDCFAQALSLNQDSVKILMRKEHSFSINLNTQGGGFGFRTGHHLTGYKKLMYEGEFVMVKDPKEKRLLIYPVDQNSKPFFYGKLNYFYILRAGMGIQNVINSKPYWGGVEVRYFYFGGLDLGFTKPSYLYIITSYDPQSHTAVINSERYDPGKHNLDNIYGRGPFTDGLGEIQIHPGLYGKFGFNFEFGQEEEKIRCLEVGLNLDAFPKPIPIMAFKNNEYLFLSFYLSYSFGKRLVN
jgi:hypothetical protein